MEAQEFRTVSLTDLLRRALRMYYDTLVPAVPIALALNLPLLVIGALPMEAEEGSPWLLSLVLVLVLICSGIAVSSITRILISNACGILVPFGTLVKLTFRRSLIAMILGFAITSFLSNLGLLVFVLPGLLAGGLFAVTLPAILVERRSALSALVRSVSLMRMDIFKAMAAFSFGTIASELVPLGIMLGLQSAVGPSPFSPLLAVLINGITLPIALSVGVALYESARMSEGLQKESVRRELAQAAIGDVRQSQ